MRCVNCEENIFPFESSVLVKVHGKELTVHAFTTEKGWWECKPFSKDEEKNEKSAMI